VRSSRLIFPALFLVLLFLALLLPSAWLAFHWRDMPQLGFQHDDSIYFVNAKSLAQGDGYRIASLPQQPPETKYPPLYAAWLSLVWRINPNFPANLPLATLFGWLAFPPFVWLSWRFFNKQNLPRWECAVLTSLIALNPESVLLSVSLLSELQYTCFLLAALLLAERASRAQAPLWLAVAAGCLGALCYLTRAAALSLLLAAPLVFLLQRLFRQAAVFVACMLPAVLGWQMWVRANQSPSHDLVTLYYTNYLGFQLYNVPLRDVPFVVWQNMDQLLAGITKLLIFDSGFENIHIQRLVAVIALAGVVRLARQSRRFHYPLAGAVFLVMLLVWHYPPDQRFVFPLYPLLLAGFWTELKNVALALRRAWQKKVFAERAAATLAGAVLAALSVFVLFTNLRGDFSLIPQALDGHRAELKARQPAYAWIAEHTPKTANVFAFRDPVLYLYVDRKSCKLPIPPRLIYHQDEAGLADLVNNLSEFAHEQRLDYVLVTDGDYLALQDAQNRNFDDRIKRSQSFQAMARFPGSAVYLVRPKIGQ